jgi:hypothetical protein
MSALRKMLRQQIEGIEEPDQPSGSAALAAYVRDMKQVETDLQARREAEAAQAAKPQPQSLADVLRLELEEHQERGEHPSLNDQRLLQIAAGTPDAPHSVREEVSGILRRLWDQQGSQPKP